jgi:primary-amine oxidase
MASEYLVEVSSSAPTKIVSAEPTPANLHVPVDTYEMIAAEEALLNHPEFKAAVAKMDLPKDAKVVADAWIYGRSLTRKVTLIMVGADSTDPAPRYITFMVYLSFDSNPDTCHYAAPLPITPTILADTLEMVRIDYTPIFGKGDKTILDLEGRFPWEAYKSNEYDQALLESRGEKMRANLKPLRVVQPEGTSVSQAGS